MKKIFLTLLKSTLAALLLILLVGCSGANDQTEINELQAENEKLRAELESVIANSGATEQLDLEPSAEKNQSAQSETVLTQDNIVPPQLEPEELLIGEWFYTEFHEAEMNNWTQSLIFNADYTGEIIRTFYLPKDIEEYSSSDLSGEVSLGFSWSLDGETVHTEYEEEGGAVDYTFSSTQQQLIQIKEDGKKQTIYERKKPIISEKYVEVNVLMGDIQATEAGLMRKFVGNWYFDVLTWTFNDDGTGVLDIPKLGEQPATKRYFSYSVDEAKTGLLMTLDWSDSKTSYFWATITDNGAITLKTSSDAEEIRLTRNFDASNCPISQEILENTLSVLSGSIIYEILPAS